MKFVVCSFTAKRGLYVVSSVEFLVALLLKQWAAYLVCQVCMCVDLFKTPPLEMAFPTSIPLFQVRIWIHHKKLTWSDIYF